ncbi:CRISPR-associated protein Cas4 [Anaerosinus massiliensis]|uniref:CRISPR-associated protein Cas4 n=1 Tax=Massilibacillus massiliensis TaxID=1806837 RepID=UPI000DA612F9|nr:CRISPR-associated protein Cas4 [Massilibacillus massiliensis]
MKQVTGVIYSYYFLCKRKMWLYARDISLEDESERVQIGKIIDETSYSRERKHILVDDCINIDYIHNGIVYEVKKSQKEKQMAIQQIKYYLYVLHKHGLKDVQGVLAVPKEHLTEEVFLTEDDIKMVAHNLELIKEALLAETLPATIDKPACKSCAYYEFCYI